MWGGGGGRELLGRGKMWGMWESVRWGGMKIDIRTDGFRKSIHSFLKAMCCSRAMQCLVVVYSLLPMRLSYRSPFIPRHRFSFHSTSASSTARLALPVACCSVSRAPHFHSHCPSFRSPCPSSRHRPPSDPAPAPAPTASSCLCSSSPFPRALEVPLTQWGFGALAAHRHFAAYLPFDCVKVGSLYSFFFDGKAPANRRLRLPALPISLRFRC